MSVTATSPTGLVDAVDRRLREGEDPLAVIADLAGRRKFGVEAAYAVARRSHRDTAADVIELGLLERQRGGAAGGHRWYHRAEVFHAPQVIILVNPAIQVLREPSPLTWAFLGLVVAAVAVFGVWVARTMSSVERHVPAVGDLAGTTVGTVGRRGAEVASAALASETGDVVRWRRMAGDADDRLSRYQAAAAITAAQKAVAGLPWPRRRATLDDLDAARRAILADLG